MLRLPQSAPARPAIKRRVRTLFNGPPLIWYDSKTMNASRFAPLAIFPLLLAAQQTDLLNTLRFRQIGPFRGGRSVAVAGVPSQPDTYYFGAVGGGVFKTTDSGLTWVPVSVVLN